MVLPILPLLQMDQLNSFSSQLELCCWIGMQQSLIFFSHNIDNVLNLIGLDEKLEPRYMLIPWTSNRLGVFCNTWLNLQYKFITKSIVFVTLSPCVPSWIWIWIWIWYVALLGYSNWGTYGVDIRKIIFICCISTTLEQIYQIFSEFLPRHDIQEEVNSMIGTICLFSNLVEEIQTCMIVSWCTFIDVHIKNQNFSRSG